MRENRARFRRDAVPALARANSIYIPTGRWATHGWLLLARSDYDKISRYGTSLVLTVGDPRDPYNVAALNKLSIVQAQCVTSGITSDKDAVYLVEVTDGRGVAHNEWFQAPLKTAYNIRSPAYPQMFYSDTMNGAVPWTWSEMVRDMWAKVNAATGTALGAWPGLPASPTGTPEGFWFAGVPGWYAICDVLEHVGMTVACDLQLANPLTIVQSGVADATHAALRTAVTGSIEDSQEWIDTGAGRLPGTVVVLFRRRNSVYGTEETVRRDTSQWSTTAYYEVSAAGAASGVGTHHLWDDFTVRYDDDGSPLAADVVTATARATERASDYFRRVYHGSLGYMSETYAGALPFTTGPQVDGVCYYQDYRGQSRHGWKTKIVRGPCPPFREVGCRYLLQEE